MNPKVASTIAAIEADDAVEVRYVPRIYHEAAESVGIKEGMWRTLWVSATCLPQFEEMIGPEYVAVVEE
jgi:hypothetical protein